MVAASAQVVAGSTVQLAASSSSAYWEVRGWSDGGAAFHSLAMPDADLTLAARYRTAIDARYAALGARASFLKSPTSAEYDMPGGRPRNFAGDR